LARPAQGVRQLEFRLEAVLAAVGIRHVREVFPRAGREQRDGGLPANVRQHLHPRARLRRGRKRGQENQALGRSRGGFGTKIHIKCDAEGLPLDFHLTGNEASDTKQFETLLEIGPDATPEGVIADKGYDSEANRQAARDRGIVPVIPRRKNARDARPVSKDLYRLRARIEQLNGKLKRFKRIAMRCEKTKRNFASFIAWAMGIIWIKSVHRA
jgi:transposase